jgi:hypothetical protein
MDSQHFMQTPFSLYHDKILRVCIVVHFWTCRTYLVTCPVIAAPFTCRCPGKPLGRRTVCTFQLRTTSGHSLSTQQCFRQQKHDHPAKTSTVAACAPARAVLASSSTCNKYLFLDAVPAVLLTGWGLCRLPPTVSGLGSTRTHV